MVKLKAADKARQKRCHHLWWRCYNVGTVHQWERCSECGKRRIWRGR